MRFLLVDRILEIAPRERIVAEKAVSLAEEYLADHFPTFPVLPGVMMVEAMVQTAAWAVRVALDFRPSIVVLSEARNVTYKSFVTPGRVLRLIAEPKELTAESSVFNASGEVDGREIVKGKLTLRHLNLSDNNPELAATDERLRARYRGLYELLKPKSIGAAMMTEAVA